MSPSTYTRAQANLLQCPAQSGPRYRRSRTTKAPRKRTFLLTMQKPSTLRAAEATLRGSSTACCAVVGKEVYDVCFGGNDGNGSGNNVSRSRWGGDGAGDESQRRPFSFAAIIGAMALSMGILAPLPSIAAPIEADHSTTLRSTAYKLPKSVVMRNATLVIPNAGNMALARRSAPGSILYGAMYITEDEKRQAGVSQFNAREAMRIN